MADYGSSVNFSERTTDIDTPPSGKAGIFLRDDKALYLKNDDGTVTKFGLAGDAPTAHAESHESGGTDELALDAGQVTTGTLPVARGGTGATTLTGFVQGTGTSALTAAALAASDLPAGTLTLGAAMDGTLRTVEDKAGTESALQISTTGTCVLADNAALDLKRKTLGTGAGKGVSLVRFLDNTGGQRGYFGFSSIAGDSFGFVNSTAEEEMKFVITNASSSIRPMVRMDGGATNGRLAFFSTDPIEKPTVSGSRGGNAALASLCTALANLGLITDSTT